MPSQGKNMIKWERKNWGLIKYVNCNLKTIVNNCLFCIVLDLFLVENHLFSSSEMVLTTVDMKLKKEKEVKFISKGRYAKNALFRNSLLIIALLLN